MRWRAACLVLLFCGVFATPAFALPDSDADGVPDGSDNCVFVANSSQADLDGDHIGDACDTDIDGDGYANSVDAFPRNPAEHLDTDGDGIGDNADTDDDGDGTPDTYDALPLNANEVSD